VTPIKTIALAVALTAAFTATIGAAGASASGFVTGSYPTTLKAVPISTHVLKTWASLPCGGPIFSGSASGPSGAMEASQVEDSICAEFGSIQRQLRMNGCHLNFHPGAEEAPGKFAGTFDIGPSGCGPVKLESSCKVTIPAQAGLKASFENKGEGSTAYVQINAEASGMKYTQGLGCGSEGTFSTGTWTGSWKLSGANNFGSSTSVAVRANGLFLAGKESVETSQRPRLEAEKYPALLTSEVASTHRFDVDVESVTCKSATFGGSLSGSSNAMSVNAEYAKCSTSTAVVMNSCHYVFHVANAGPPYLGTMDIACNPGDSIELRVPFCTVKIGPQSGLSGVGFTNEGATSSRMIKISLNVTGISYNECGTARTDGSYTGSEKVGAVY
jgi:hypothetical protein